MMRAILGALFSAGLMVSAQAAIAPAQLDNRPAVTLVANGCGHGFWRADNGTCHPMAHHRVCPPHYHLGMHGGQCWPN